MERSAKRKAISLSTDADRPKKKLKVPDSKAAKRIETVEGTTEAGLHFIEALRRAQDKNGRLIATAFLSLPNPLKKEFPDYYRHIELPISVESIEAKLRDGKYPTMTTVESDVKRMVNNAKQYNESKSEIYQDAERVRKMTFNHMSKANPAYQKGNYQAIPTPLPSETTKTTIRLTGPSSNETPASDKRQSEPLTQQGPSRSTSAAAAEDEAEGTSEVESFEGKTFQLAQEKLLSEMMKYQDEASGLIVFTPFINLPPRSLTDYYTFIKQPTSLRSIMNKARGRQGKAEATGITVLKSWDAFENEVAKIWDNAREYNEDGSDMFLLAGEFEEYFKERLSEAKKHVQEPPQPKLKLNMAPQPPPSAGLKLTLNSQKSSPIPQPQVLANAQRRAQNLAPNGQSNVPDVAANEANPSQGKISMRLPNQAVNGAAGLATAASSSVNGSSSLSISQSNIPTSSSAVNGKPANSVGSVAPSVSTAPRALSGSPFPGQPYQTSQPYIPFPQQSASGFDSKWRQEGRDPLFSNVHITTPPESQSPKAFKCSIPPHSKLSQQHLTLHLPPGTSVLRFQPELSPLLKAPTPKPHKLFVTSNNLRVPPRELSTQQTGTAVSQNGPIYDVRLAPGMNRVEVECASIANSKANGLRPGLGELEMERVSVFVHLLKG